MSSSLGPRTPQPPGLRLSFEVEQPYLTAWHATEPRLLLGTREGLLEWAPRGVSRLASNTGLNTLGYWGERVVLADELGGLEILGGPQLQLGIGRIDELAPGPELGLIGDTFATLRSDGSLRFVFPSAAMPTEAWWCDDRWLLRDEHGAFLLSVEGEVLEWRELPEAARVWWDGELRVASLQVEDPFLRPAVLGPGGALAAEGRDHVIWLAEAGGAEPHVVEGHPRTVTTLAFGRRGELVTGCRDGAVRRLRGEAFEPIELAPIAATSLRFSHDGEWLCVAGRDEAHVLPWPP